MRRLVSWIVSKIAWQKRRTAGRGDVLEAMDTISLRQRQQSNNERLATIKSSEAGERLARENARIEEILRERGDG